MAYSKIARFTTVATAALSLAMFSNVNAQSAWGGYGGGGSGGSDYSGGYYSGGDNSGGDFHTEVYVGGGGRLSASDIYGSDYYKGRYLDSSVSATHFYFKGVSNLAKGQLDKSEKAFKIALKNPSSDELDKLTLKYLARINHQLGNESEVKNYITAYRRLEEN